MFQKLKEKVGLINENQNTFEGQQQAQKTKKTLNILGIIISIFGYIAVFSCFVGFMLGGIFMVGKKEQNFSQIFIPFFLYVPVSIFIRIGKEFRKISKSIILIDEHNPTQNLNNSSFCECGQPIEKGDFLCRKCGRRVTFVCPYCKTENDGNVEYCRGCGNKLW